MMDDGCARTTMEDNAIAQALPSTPTAGRYYYDYNLDTVTNGIQATEPTLFLTVRRFSAAAWQQQDRGRAKGNGVPAATWTVEDDNENSEKNSTVVARYAILGLSDMTARLVADQRFSWTCIRAVFGHNNGTSGGLWGLPGLWLALHGAGVPDMTVVTGNPEDATRVERLTELLEVHRRHPQIRISAVPKHAADQQSTDTKAGSSSSSSLIVVSWWEIYEDELIIVHGTTYEKPEQLIYLFTMKQHPTVTNFTMAILPSPCAWNIFPQLWSHPNNRVVLESTDVPSNDKGAGEEEADDGNSNHSQRKRRRTTPQFLSIHTVVTQSLPDQQDSSGAFSCFVAECHAATDSAPILLCQPSMAVDRAKGFLMRTHHFAEVVWKTLIPRPNFIWRSPQLPDNSSLPAVLKGSVHELLSCSTVRLTGMPMEIIDRARPILQRLHKKPNTAISIHNKSGSSALRKMDDPCTDDTYVASLRDFFLNFPTPSPTTINGQNRKTPIEVMNASYHCDEIEIGIDAVDDVHEEVDDNEIRLDDSDNDDPNNSVGVIKDNNEIELEEEGGESFTDDYHDQENHKNGNGVYCAPARNGERVDGRAMEWGGNEQPWADTAHLLVLGTGCASPSAVRGSSGYGLLFPQQRLTCEGVTSDALLLTAIVECGEGTLTMLSRHLPDVLSDDSAADNSKSREHAGISVVLDLHLLHVKFIWISHAHWDHYGGLPALLQGIHLARQRYCQSQKGTRMSAQAQTATADDVILSPVWVIAPPKVLKYLDIALKCHRGVSENGATRAFAKFRLFHGCTQEQVHSWWPFISTIHLARRENAPKIPSSQEEMSAYEIYTYRPFVFWENVRVEHSCFDAFGFVMGIRAPHRGSGSSYCSSYMLELKSGEDSVVTFAYSGDTKPCWQFVQRCRYHSSQHGRMAFMLHEASFDADQSVMAVKKRHSTISDALKVATDTNTEALVLTHFSQRYDRYPPMQLPLHHYVPKVIFALDGMLIPLL